MNKNKAREVIKVYNPENLSVFDDNLIADLNNDIEKNQHGPAKYVHGIAKYNFPELIKRQNSKDFGRSFDITTDSPEVLRLENCYISDLMIVLDQKGEIVQQNLNTYWDWDDNVAPNNSFKPSKFYDLIIKFLKLSAEQEFILRKKIAFKEYSKGLAERARKLEKQSTITKVKQALIFTDQYFYVFGHFAHENYPRLYFLFSQLSDEEKRDFKIILPPIFHPHFAEEKPAAYLNFIKPCLEAFGIKEEQCIYVEKGSMIKVETLLMPSQIRFHPLVKESTQYLTDFYRDDSDKFKDYQKIYLSRRNAPRRRLINELEVQEFLIKRGFKIVVLEDLDFKAQMNILANARVVIAQDSSTLTNIIFCHKSTDCLILTCDKITCPFFSTAVDARFYYQFCEPEDRTNFTWYSSNIIADIDQLEKNLNVIESRT